MLKILSYGIVILSIGVGYLVYDLYKVPDLPDVDFDKWWGDGTRGSREDTSIRSFKITFNDTMIDDLRSRLRQRRPFTRPMDGIQSEYGINTDYLNEILNYWQDKYNFTDRAAALSQFPHFKTNIQGLDIQFIRVKPKQVLNTEVCPILLLHGWPSSSKEFDKIIPMLTEARKEYNFVFEIVAADLPGFGYSQGTNKPGLNPLQISVIMHNLMKRLGYDKYYIHAGDWGSQVAAHMSTMFQNEILGYHTNFLLSVRRLSMVKHFFGSLLFPNLLVEEKLINRLSLPLVFRYVLKESGYYHLQATKPDTIGAALTDSPVGMAAYLLEKIGMCSNRDQTDTPHGGLENIDRDDLLDIITIMWANERITSSVRLYAEGHRWSEVFVMHEIPTRVPTASVNFRYEVLFQPDWIVRDKFHNLVRSTTYDYGGHFAALHTPEELVDDIFASVAEFKKYINK